MTPADFATTVHAFLDHRLDLLFKKNAGYNPQGDAMGNFKKAAVLKEETPEQALWGMAAKHIVSVSDMVMSGKDYDDELWDEKIGDSINFFLLLRALVADVKSEAPTLVSEPIYNISINN